MTDASGTVRRRDIRLLDREIFRLAIPALGALVAEPLFLLTDTALVGHLGADSLAGLGIASVILHTAIGLLIFLAYATTPMVARRLGAGDRAGAVRAGFDGMWLALLIGVLLALLGIPTIEPLVAAFGSTAAVSAAAESFLFVSLWGVPPMLMVIAATGLLRGLQNTRTPLVIAVIGFATNAALNAVFIYGFGWGIAGSAAGTVVAQWGMAIAYAVITIAGARQLGASIRPALSGVVHALRSGGWLLVRTVSLRVAMVATVVMATSLGVPELAAMQVALSVFSAVTFALDALAIAGQALIGHALGARDLERVRTVTRRLVQLALIGGVLMCVVIASLSPVLAPVFTGDAEVQGLLWPVLAFMAVCLPLAGYVFVLDGVLIGAGDARYLAIVGVVNLVVYLPLLWLAGATGLQGGIALIAIWAAFGLGFMGSRGVTLGLRARGDRWMVLTPA